MDGEQGGICIAGSAELCEAIDSQLLNWDRRFRADTKSKTLRTSNGAYNQGNCHILSKLQPSGDTSVSSEAVWYTCKDLVTDQYDYAPVVDARVTSRAKTLCNQPCFRGKLIVECVQSHHEGAQYQLSDKMWQQISEHATVEQVDRKEVVMWVPPCQDQHFTTTTESGNTCLDGLVASQNAHGGCYPVFVPSGGKGRSTSALLQWPQSDRERCRVIVVRPIQYDEYYKLWGGEYAILVLPMTMKKLDPPCVVHCNEGKIGFSRLFIQVFTAAAGCDWIWMVDDNVHYV